MKHSPHSFQNPFKHYWPFFITLILCVFISSCADFLDFAENENQHDVPLKGKALRALKAKNLNPEDPILIRIFKQERVLEIWKKPKSSDKMALLTTYKICAFSGELGPKKKEGDKQSPEGFYHVGKAQMNPYSSFHLSFNLGYPNLYERTNKQTGSLLMVHGDCRSVGCYAMTDNQIEEIYALVREAHSGGQRRVQVQAFPFRMSDRNMQKHNQSDNFDFWQNLKQGYDAFEITRKPIKVDVCNRRYVFNKVTTKKGTRFNPKAACPPMRSLTPKATQETADKPTLAPQNTPINKSTFSYTNEQGQTIDVISF